MTDPHTTAEAAIRAWWDATSGSYCDLGPTFLLCEDAGGIAARGTCPEHGGDACLYVYGKLDAALAELASVRVDLEAAREALRDLIAQQDRSVGQPSIRVEKWHRAALAAGSTE